MKKGVLTTIMTACLICGLFAYPSEIHAKTSGYYKYHYVRSYIGGSNSNATNAWADTGRKYSNGDLQVRCRTRMVFIPEDCLVYRSTYYPRAYSKYGN